MRATTLRHLIVVTVACLGVGGLYLLPNEAAGPLSAEQELAAGGSARTTAARTPAPEAPGSQSTGSAPSPAASYDPDAQVTTAAPSGRLSAASPQVPGPRPDVSIAPGTSAPSTTGGLSATTAVPTPPDTTPPSAPSGLQVVKVDAETATLRWRPATDDRAVVRYNVYVNQYNQVQTTSTLAQVRWYRDDTSARHVFRVTAVDAAGNEGPPSGAVVLSPPTTSTPSPTQRPTSPVPTASSPTSGTTSPSPTSGPTSPSGPPTQHPTPGPDPTSGSSAPPTPGSTQPAGPSTRPQTPSAPPTPGSTGSAAAPTPTTTTRESP